MVLKAATGVVLVAVLLLVVAVVLVLELEYTEMPLVEGGIGQVFRLEDGLPVVLPVQVQPLRRVVVGPGLRLAVGPPTRLFGLPVGLSELMLQPLLLPRQERLSLVLGQLLPVLIVQAQFKFQLADGFALFIQARSLSITVSRHLQKKRFYLILNDFI